MEDITMDTARKEAEEMKKKEAERKAKKEAEKAKKAEAKASAPKKTPVFDNITDETAYKEAQEMKKKEAERKAASGGSSFWDRIKGNMGGASGGAGHPVNAPAPETQETPGKTDTIANSIEAQANAKPGDVVNGRTLTQGDINWAKEQMAKNTPEDTEAGTPQETQEVGNGEDVSVSGGIEESNIDSPEITEAMPDINAPEVQKAIGAGGAEIEDAEDDEAKQNNFKQKYCNAIWEDYEEGMTHQPQFKPGWQLPATILSIGLSVFSGGLIPPVNFMKLTGKEDAYNAAMDMWKETMGKATDLGQEKQKSSEMPTAKAEGMEAAKDIASQEAIDQAAEVNAAEQTGAQANARLGTEGELEAMAKQADIDMAMKKLEQLHEEKMKGLDATLAKDLAKFTANSQIALQQAAANNDMDKIRELYRETVNQKGDVLKALGYDVSPDGFLKFQRNMGATSNAQARIKTALDIADTAANAAGTVAGAMKPM